MTEHKHLPMGKFRVEEGVAYLDDDGGAAKSNERLIRRRRQRIIRVIKYPIIIGVLFFTLSFIIDLSSGDELALQRKEKLQRALRYGVPKNSINNIIHNHRHPKSDDNSGDGMRANDNDKKTPYRWTKESILPPVHGQKAWERKYLEPGRPKRGKKINTKDFKVRRNNSKYDWESVMKDMDDDVGPKIDYTEHDYDYPDFIAHPPRGGSYPPMEPLGDILGRWPQDDIDTPPFPFEERLQHFDFNEPEDMEAAKRYRDIEFPFKLVNVPELFIANEKWTDEYLSYHFDRSRMKRRHNEVMQEFDEIYHKVPKSEGHCQESVDNFFAFFNNKHWNLETMGDPPTMDNDFTFERWATHARFADAVSLDSSEMHYYWQSGVPRREREGPEDQQSMISLDLPSFADDEPNFISFNPEENKGIQCRFGERGVTAATHYDGGRNMVGMITGAKRYILSPPNQCANVSLL